MEDHQDNLSNQPESAVQRNPEIKIHWPTREEYHEARRQYVTDHLHKKVQEYKDLYQIDNDEIALLVTDCMLSADFTFRLALRTFFNDPGIDQRITFIPLTTEDKQHIEYGGARVRIQSADGEYKNILRATHDEIVNRIAGNERIECLINAKEVIDQKTYQRQMHAYKSELATGAFRHMTYAETADDHIVNQMRAEVCAYAMHEAGHVIYDLVKIQDPAKAGLLVASMENYTQAVDQRMEGNYNAYLKHDLERRADLWKKAFLRRYFPETTRPHVKQVQGGRSPFKER